VPNPKHLQKEYESLKINSVYGSNGRTFNYVSKASSQFGKKFQSPKDKVVFKDKIDYKNDMLKTQKNWNHFDSNMNNYLVEQRKIIYSKNYEIDSRAWGLKDYGVQPMIGQQLKNSRKINGILLDQTQGKSHEDRVPLFKKNYTPITSYQKAIIDAKVTTQGGSNISSLRPYLNYS